MNSFTEDTAMTIRSYVPDMEANDAATDLASVPCAGGCGCCGSLKSAAVVDGWPSGVSVKFESDGLIAADPVAAVEGSTALLGTDQQAIKVWFGDTGYKSQAEPYGSNGEWVGQKDWVFTEIALVWSALRDIERLIDVKFVQAASAAAADLDFIFNSNGGSFGTTGSITETEGAVSWNQATIRINPTIGNRWAQGRDVGGRGYETLVHEIGHALGLDHTHDAALGSDFLDGITPGTSFDGGPLGLNDPINSIMANRDGWAAQDTSQPAFGNRINMGAWDIQALINRYGANTETASGDDIYELPFAAAAGSGFVTIYDTDGFDRITANNALQAAVIDLRPATLDYDPETSGGPVSYLWAGGTIPIRGGFTIAAGTFIEGALGGRGADTITGNTEANTLDGRDGNDLIAGGEGADTITGGRGADTLTGGAGADLYLVSGTDAHGDVITDFGSGDRVRFDRYIAPSSLVKTVAGGNTRVDIDTDGNGSRETSIVFSGTFSLDIILESNTARTQTTLSLGQTSLISVQGTPYKDILTTSNSAELIEGFAGNDSLVGRAGDDSILGGLGADVLRGQDGNDTLLGGDGNDRLRGDNGADLILGEAGADDIRGGFGADIIDGGTGNDYVRGEGDDDLITDASGRNVLFGDGGNDTITGGVDYDRLYGGVGFDILNGGAGNDFAAGGRDGDTIFGFTGDDSLFGEDGNDSIDGGDGLDRIEGGNGNDTLRGDAGDDRLIAQGGDDYIDAGIGNDRIDAGIGNDYVIGGNGADFIRAGAGRDTLRGGRDNDTIEGGYDDDIFMVFRGDGADRFTDFDQFGNDVIRFSGFGAAFNTFQEVMAVASQLNSTTVRIDFGGGDTLTLDRTTLASLTADDFLFG